MKPRAWLKEINQEKDGVLWTVRMTTVESVAKGWEEPYIPLYEKREWVGLTDRDIEAIWGEDVSLMYSGHYDAIRAIEAKLRGKNT